MKIDGSDENDLIFYLKITGQRCSVHVSCSHILVFVVILYSLEHITRDIEIINDDIHVF